MAERDFSRPDSRLAVMLDAAADAIETKLTEHGFGQARMLIALHCGTAPIGEQDSCVAGFGYDDSVDLAGELATHFAAVLKAHGLDVKIVPLQGGAAS